MRFHFIVVLVLFIFSTVTSAESGIQNSETFASNHNVNVRRELKLREGRKLTADGELLVDNEERGLWTSTNNFVSKLRGRIQAKNAAGVTKTDKLNDAQIKSVSKAVATEVKKNPKAWPVIKNGLLIVFGTVLVTLIIAGVYPMLHSMRNYQ